MEGRYRDRAEVVAAGVALQRERDAARAAFRASVLAAEEEVDREGCVYDRPWRVAKAQDASHF